MNRTGRRSMIVLAALSVLATVGLVWLGIQFAGLSLSSWTLEAALSPMAVRCLIIAGVCLAVLALIAGILIRLRPAGRGAARQMHGDQGGTAAIEMTLLLPIALVMFLMIIQAVLVFNARMVMNYAAFAASRVAIVVVPRDMESEGPNLVWPYYVGASAKVEKMRMAAVLALIPISPKMAGEVDELGLSLDNQLQMLFSGEDSLHPWWVNRVKAQYRFANQFTDVSIDQPEHWRDGDPDNDCPYSKHYRGDWVSGNWTWIPYCPYHVPHRDEDIWDYAFWEDLTVTVRYPFVLQIPYACKVMYDLSGEDERDIVEINDRQYYALKFTWTLAKEKGALSNEGGFEVPVVLQQTPTSTVPM
jgi:hypothetical protein